MTRIRAGNLPNHNHGQLPFRDGPAPCGHASACFIRVPSGTYHHSLCRNSTESGCSMGRLSKLTSPNRRCNSSPHKWRETLSPSFLEWRGQPLTRRNSDKYGNDDDCGRHPATCGRPGARVDRLLHEDDTGAGETEKPSVLPNLQEVPQCGLSRGNLALNRFPQLCVFPVQFRCARLSRKE